MDRRRDAGRRVATTAAAGVRPDPIDWALAERVARRVARSRDPLASSYLAESLRDDFDVGHRRGRGARRRAHRAARRRARRAAQVVDRAAWVSANVSSMRRLLAPLTARVGERMAASPVAPIGRRVAGTETGVLLGYLAQRVLGQYDLLVPDDDARAADAVYYVGGNVLALEKRFAFRPRDFRLWIAIHEVHAPGAVHRRAVDEAATTSSLVDARCRRSTPTRAASCRRWRARPTSSATAATRSTTAASSRCSRATSSAGALAQVQALMSLLEGHGNA